MENIRLNNDSEMPVIGLGTWQSGPGEAYQAVRWAIKLGYKMIDCAPIYGNEAEIGQAIADAINEGDIKRKDLFVVSKLWNDSHAPEDVEPALDKTLNDLQLEYLDLYLMHWPVAQKKGTALPKTSDDLISLNEIPLDLTWTAMEKLAQSGKVETIGVSNFSPVKLSNLLEKAEIVPAVNQVECHPLLPQNDLLDFCRKNNMTLMAYSPLGSRQKEAHVVLENPTVMKIAEKLQASPAQVVLAWQLQRGVCVIPKSVHEARLRENFAAQVLKLDDEDMAELSGLQPERRFISGAGFMLPESGYDNLWDEKG